MKLFSTLYWSCYTLGLKRGGDCILFKGTKKKILPLSYRSPSLASAPEQGSGEESWPLAAGDTRHSPMQSGHFPVSFSPFWEVRSKVKGHCGNHKYKFAKIS